MVHPNIAPYSRVFKENVFNFGENIPLDKSLEMREKFADVNVRPVFSCFVNYMTNSPFYGGEFKKEFENWYDLYNDGLSFFDTKEVFIDAGRLLEKYNLLQ